MTLSRDIWHGTLRIVARRTPIRRQPSVKPEVLALDESRRELDKAVDLYEEKLAAHKRRAIAAVNAGVSKTEVAQRAGYTTRQLDRWIAEAKRGDAG